MKINLEPYQPRTNQSFWCNRCDQGPVDSAKPESGSFFIQFGHSFNQGSREYDGAYTGVMFAFCKPCMDKDAA